MRPLLLHATLHETDALCKVAGWLSGRSGSVSAMATMVSFHAHPDDECIACGGVIRKAFEEGHRVVLVVATRGERGEVPDGFLADGEELWQRRVAETHASAEILGAQRVEFLGYIDSGMMGTPANNAPGSFWSAPVDEAAKKLAAILQEERADVLTCYDDIGGYGHPDHIQVHRVGMRAAEMAGTPRVYQNTMNRDHIERGRAAFIEQAAAAGMDVPEDALDDAADWGKPESVITAAVDVTPYVKYKRRAMRAHPSQIGEASFFLALPDEAFRYGFGTEWFIRDGQGPGITETDLMAGL
jgi:LmbE family N-acetylglucosaminyl deacetylase